MPIGVIDIIPQSVSYFEQFAGPNPFAKEPETYFQEVLIPYRKALLHRDLSVGLDICCLGALRNDLTPGQWVSDIDNDTIWNALSSSNAKTNPFSLLGALDVTLHRLEDPRFLEFSAEAVAKLSEESCGQPDGPDSYKLLQIFSNFVLNGMNLLENGANFPGYWKRMCAWMQAGLIVRAMTESSVSMDIDALEQWSHSSMTMAGGYALFVDTRKEPMLSSNLVTPVALRYEIFSRLLILKSRHENEGRYLPKAEDINRAIVRSQSRGEIPVWNLPGPLEGHRRPTEPISQEATEKLNEALPDGVDPLLLQQFAAYSQFIALGEAELELAREIVMTTTESILNTDPHESLNCLEFAGTIAATNRDTVLADVIADAVVKIAPNISEEKDIHVILRIILQAAAAYEEHEAWFKWLEEKLAGIASHLPSPPKKYIRIFINHLDELGRILPVDSWFHIRARSIASAGAE